MIFWMSEIWPVFLRARFTCSCEFGDSVSLSLSALLLARVIISFLGYMCANSICPLGAS